MRRRAIIWTVAVALVALVAWAAWPDPCVCVLGGHYDDPYDPADCPVHYRFGL